MLRRWNLLGGAALPLAVTAVGAAEPVLVRVNVFPGVSNLPIFAGLATGIFARHDLKLDLQFTPDSTAQRAGLARGAFDVAHAAVDNAVAMVEAAGADAVIVMGGDNGMLELVVQSDIGSLAELRGKTVIVDAPNTAFALVLRKILLTQGLQAGRDYTLQPTGGSFRRFELMKQHKAYAASMLNPPFSVLAVREGLRSLGPATKVIGPYQAGGAFVMRPWAQANAAPLERYIRAYVESLRWVLAPANRGEAIAMLAERLKLPPDVAATTYDLAAGGFAPDARFDLEGFRNVLALRAELEGQWGGKPPAPDTYVDLSYYQRAVAALGR